MNKPSVHYIKENHVALILNQIGELIFPIISRYAREYNERPDFTDVDVLSMNPHHVYDAETKTEIIRFGPAKTKIAQIKSFSFEIIDGQMTAVTQVKLYDYSSLS